jgi:hypothetical protein
MFPKENLYIYKGSRLNVLCPFKKTPFDNHYVIDAYNIYLGKFIRSKKVEWTNDKQINDGIAIFEYGCIYFPNYRNIFIMNAKLFSDKYKIGKIDHTSKVSFDDSIIYLYDIYNGDDVIEDLIED